MYLSELNERCDAFIKDARLTVSQFCKQVDMSREAFYAWRNGDLSLTSNRVNSIESFLDSKTARNLIEKARAFPPIAECSAMTGLKQEKIRSLCKNNVIRYKQSSGNRYYVNIEDLKRYLKIQHPNGRNAEKKPEDNMLAFGNLHSAFDVVWKPVLSANYDYEIFQPDRYEYDNRYWISNSGRIYNTATGEILGNDSDCGGYVKVNLLKNGVRETPYVHVLVAYHFCPNRHFKTYVHHIDGNKKNNHAKNLVWVTKAEHDECHRLLKRDKRAYRQFIKQIQKGNKW